VSEEELIEQVEAEEGGDPNRDLIGFEYKGVGGKQWKVTGTPVWSEGNYVQIECEDGTLSAVGAGLVRQRIQEQRNG
jgi:hypothetical protein